MTRVYVSIGSNIDREHNVRSAVGALRRRYGPLTVSPVYETEAVGFTGDAFYNLVVGFETDDDAPTLSRAFHDIEAEHGRVRGGEKFSSRTLDLDLLTWGDAVLHDQGLNVPRHEILKYSFVLRPLADVAAGERHPLTGRRYGDLWAEFGATASPLRQIALDLD
jgi:2-amino-4-hydroxy-6-hydroxymethyldihydropteridine diphosphokinase